MRSLRAKPWLAAVLPALVACSLPESSDSRADAYARDGALAVRMGRRCAEELAAVAQPSPESASRALGTVVARRGPADEVRTRARGEIDRRVVALFKAGAFATRGGPRAAVAAAEAHGIADALCRARDVGFTLAQLPRAARVASSEAVDAGRAEPRLGAP